jgi:hypothetical protein
MKNYYAYIDESGTHEGSLHETMALALIPETLKPQFQVAWKKLLDKWQVHALHMTDFNSGKREFAGWDAERCHNFSVEAMDIVEQNVEFWMGNAFETSARHIVVNDGQGLSLYHLGFVFLLRSVEDWAKCTGKEIRVNYVLERGAAAQNSLGRALTSIFASDAGAKARFRHVSHCFEEKVIPGLQVADIFAWQLHVDARRFDREQNRRGDFARLLQIPHVVGHFDSESLRLVRQGLAS